MIFIIPFTCSFQTGTASLLFHSKVAILIGWIGTQTECENEDLLINENGAFVNRCMNLISFIITWLCVHQCFINKT